MRTDIRPEGPAAAPAAPAGRIPGLDLLRVLAIFLVFGRHMWAAPRGLPRPLAGFFDAWTRGGWVGVDLFFVLSGFLVSGILFAEYRKTGGIAAPRFYMRRGWKIYPAFFALIGVTAAMKASPRFEFSGSQMLSEVLFLQNYLPAKWNHTWSLAVEEHFYLLLPLLLIGLLRLRKGSADPFGPIVPLVATAGLAFLGLRTWNSWARPEFSYRTHLFPTHLRIDSLFFGVGIAYLYHFRRAWFERTFAPRRRGLIAVGLLALLPAFFAPLESTPWIWTSGLTLFALGSGALLIGVVLSDIPRSRAIAMLGLIGTYSYSIYLWHMPVIRWAIPVLEKVLGGELPFLARVPLYLAGSVAAGMLMGRLIEVPTLRLRERWYPSRSASPDPAGRPIPPRPRLLGISLRG